MTRTKNTATRSRRASAPKPSQPRKAQPTPAAAPTEPWKSEYAATMARLAATLDLKNLDDAERAFLATCQKIERRNTGCNSPFEEFLHNLVRYVQRDEWPTPDDAARELETFGEHFDDMKRDAAWFLENYPQSHTPRAAALTSNAVQVAPPQESAPEIDYREKDWEEKTPRELIYQLACYSPSDTEQRVNLTREEYIALKEQLARIRGFAAQEAAREEGGERGR